MNFNDICIKDISPINEKKNKINIETQKEKLFDKIKLVTNNINLNFGINIQEYDYENLYNNINKCNKTYDLFLKAYTKIMFDESKIYEIKFSDKKIIPVSNYNADFINNKTIFNFNIMCYGKSLYYHIRYIYFIMHDLFINKPIKKEQYNFTLFCDSDTFNLYQNNFSEMMKNENKEIYEKSKKSWDIFTTEYITFSNLLNKTYQEKNKNEFKYCNYEIDKFKLFKINIYFCVSSNYLMKGIGGKRSLMNYFHYNIIEGITDTNKKENYICINLDDNITMTGNFNKNCTGRREAKKQSDINTFEIPDDLKNCDNISIL